jgi:hypothetical protein
LWWKRGRRRRFFSARGRSGQKLFYGGVTRAYRRIYHKAEEVEEVEEVRKRGGELLKNFFNCEPKVRFDFAVDSS